MSELLEKIPPEKCWEITANILWRFIFWRGRGIDPSISKIIEFISDKDEGVIAPVLAWDKLEEIYEKIFGDGGKRLFPMVKEMFNIPVENALGAVKLAIVADSLVGGPEFSAELVEASPERAVIRVTKCVWMERYKEFKVDPEFITCDAGDQTWMEAGLKTVNAKLTFKLTKTMPWGDPYCECVIEFKEE